MIFHVCRPWRGSPLKFKHLAELSHFGGLVVLLNILPAAIRRKFAHVVNLFRTVSLGPWCRQDWVRTGWVDFACPLSLWTNAWRCLAWVHSDHFDAGCSSLASRFPSSRSGNWISAGTASTMSSLHRWVFWLMPLILALKSCRNGGSGTCSCSCE